ncbi:hypothetical protein ZOSMA_251G00230 [Zostera marina]|uniref:SSD domain-containing protein n=1 Tax=Zostera marina TaxID=29655 RepID=A0A0K9PI75_ZOSMR|nr:hypothetical protein ZOSMA_251G00230 [Zostera marina]
MSFPYTPHFNNCNFPTYDMLDDDDVFDSDLLWVGSRSKAAEDKQFFDSHLSPFYRIEQLILATISDTKNGKQPRILSDENMQLLFEVQKKIDGLKVNYSGSVVSLSDICLNPLGNACATQSVLQFYKMDPKKYKELGGVNHVEYCLEHYSSANSCLSAFKAPLDPSTALGGFTGKNYSEASSFIITYPVNNKFHRKGSANGKAMSWEKAFIRLVKDEIKPMVNSHNLSISFSSESSIQEELKRDSSADVITILVSYILMSVYISFALADIPNFSSFFISSKALLGFSGIVVVILSVLGSAGFYSAFGIKSTLIIMEVIPFLVLAKTDDTGPFTRPITRRPKDS